LGATVPPCYTNSQHSRDLLLFDVSKREPKQTAGHSSCQLVHERYATRPWHHTKALLTAQTDLQGVDLQAMMFQNRRMCSYNHSSAESIFSHLGDYLVPVK
jgi:hypothetical protein